MKCPEIFKNSEVFLRLLVMLMHTRLELHVLPVFVRRHSNCFFWSLPSMYTCICKSYNICACVMYKHIIYTCVLIAASSCLPWHSSVSLPQLNSFIQVCNGLIQFLCKNDAVVSSFAVLWFNGGKTAFTKKLN